MGGGLQIASVDQFPKPITQTQGKTQSKGKSQGKGRFKPKQTQSVNTFLKTPPGLKADEDPFQEALSYHCGLDWNEIKTYDINAISKDIERSINGIDQTIAKGWEKIKVSVDSAAVDTVAPPDVGKSIPIKENEISRKGINFRAANGTPIAVHGEKDLNGVNGAWDPIGMKAQIADVNKVLGSVYQMCKANNKVVFDINPGQPQQGGYIENKKNGSKTYMSVNQVTGEFQFDLWVKTPPGRDQPKISTQNRFAALQAVGEDIEGEINAADQPGSSFPRQADPL